MNRLMPATLLAVPVLTLFGGTANAASPAAVHQGAVHEHLPAELLVLHCGDGTTFTGTSGQLRFVGREGQSASGNTRFGGTVSLDHVLVTDGVQTYRAVGALSFGGGSKANTGADSDMGTFHIQIMNSGGPVASVRINGRFLDDGSLWINDHGDCAQPE